MLAGSNAFGQARTPPVVTYGVMPRARLDVQPQASDESRNLALNIAGILTPAAALTLGIIAFASATNFQQSSPPPDDGADDAQADSPGKAAKRVEIAPRPVGIPQEVVTPSTPSPDRLGSARPAAIASYDRGARESWQPASPDTARTRMVARPVGDTSAPIADVQVEAEMRPLEPARFSGYAADVSFSNSGPAKQVSGLNDKAWLAADAPAIEFQVEIVMAPQPGVRAAPQADAKYVRRDYSRTIGIAGATRDTPISKAQAARLQVPREPFRPDMHSLGRMREKIEALKNAHPRVARAKNAQAPEEAGQTLDVGRTVTGTVAPESVILSDGELAWVKIGAVLHTVEAEMAPDRYAALSGSPNAQAFISPAMLHGAGIDVDFDSATGNLSVSLAG